MPQGLDNCARGRGRRGRDRGRPRRRRAALEPPGRADLRLAGGRGGRPHASQDLAIAPADVRFAQQVMRKVVARARPGTGDFPVRHRDGSGAHRARAASCPFYDDAGELVAMVGFSTDVTEERRREADRQRNEEELEYLARASAILDSSLDLSVTLQQLAELAVPFIGDGCMVDVRREDGTIERFALAAVDERLREGFVRLQAPSRSIPPGEHPIARAMRIGRAAAAGADRRRGPRAVGQHARAPRGSAPLPRAASRWSRRSSPGERLLGTLSIALIAREGRRSSGARSRSSRSSRAALRPRSRTRGCTRSAPTSPRRCSRASCPRACPSVEGFDLAAIYRPAAGGTEVGGDFYDVFETCCGGWGVAIADVCGKGVEAAAVTALARHTLRAAALHHRRVRPRCSRPSTTRCCATSEGSQFCTVALGVVESGTRARARLTLTLGGPPALP